MLRPGIAPSSTPTISTPKVSTSSPEKTVRPSPTIPGRTSSSGRMAVWAVASGASPANTARRHAPRRWALKVGSWKGGMLPPGSGVSGASEEERAPGQRETGYRTGLRGAAALGDAGLR